MNIDLDQLYKEQEACIANPEPMPNYKQGRSIVTSCYRPELPSMFVLLSELHRLNFNIPVEIFYRDGELNKDEINELTNINPSFYKVKRLQTPCNNFKDKWGNHKGWGVKTFAIIESEYEENLWIDGDNVPIRNCIDLFNDQEYMEKGSLFWRDVYSIDRANQYCDSSVFWKIFRVPPNDGEPFESGQFLVNKPKVWKQLNVMMYFTKNSHIYFNFGGDAECWRMAWQLYSSYTNQEFAQFNYHSSNNVPYGMMPFGPFHKGIPNPWKKYGGGTVMVQRDRSGKELFNHRNLTKWTWRENPVHPDVTNEQIYHMIINHIKYKYKVTNA